MLDVSFILFYPILVLTDRVCVNSEKVASKGIKGFKQDTRHKIIDLIDLHFKVEYKIEWMKQQLNSDKTFDPINSFRIFDTSKNDWKGLKQSSSGMLKSVGKITKHKLRKAFQNNGYNYFYCS